MTNSTPQLIHVLHVENDDVESTRMGNILKKLPLMDSKITQVKELAKALEALSEQTFDIILLDLMLPNSQGVQVLKQIDLITHSTPVIALIGNQDNEMAKLAIQQGADDYLTKDETDERIIGRAIRYAIDRKETQLKLEALTLVDELTGLLGRYVFYDRLQQAMFRTQRSRRVFALLYINLDWFKSINDKFGESTGDNVLMEVGNRLKGSVRKLDTVARLGSDEFAVILEDVQSEFIASAIAQKILASLDKQMKLEERTILMSASIGISLYNGEQISADELIHRSNHAMRTVKSDGKHGIKCFSIPTDDYNI